MNKEELKKEIVENIPRDKDMELNPILVTFLLDVIEEIINHFIKNCINKSKIKNFSNLNRFQSIFLRKRINIEIKKHNLDSNYKSKLYQAFLKTGSNHDSKEIYQILNNKSMV